MDALLTAYNAGEYDLLMVVVAILVAVAGASEFNRLRLQRRGRREFYRALHKAQRAIVVRGIQDARTQWEIYEALDRWEEWQHRKVPCTYVHPRFVFEADAVDLKLMLPPDRPQHVM
jgi:hypothetical protein